MTKAMRYSEYYGLQKVFDKLYANSKENKKQKQLMDIISSRENILLAYRNIKANTGSKTKGTDGLTINDYKIMDEDEFVSGIQKRFTHYKPHSVRRVLIPKPNGKMRPLGIPTMEDRLIQQAIKQVMEPIVEAKFYKHSYGFRPNRSTHHAKSRVEFLINKAELHYVVDVDIKGFFDNVNHKKLLRQIYTLGIQDKKLLKIISEMLKAEIVGEGIPTKGTPQGGILSPLLSNIVLNELDQWVADQWEEFETQKQYSSNDKKTRAIKGTNLKRGYIVRYADDFKILTNDYQTACKWFHAVKLFLKERLKLDISPDKSKITNLRKKSTEFLGFKTKAVKKKNKFVIETHVIDKKKREIEEKVRKQVKVIRKNATPQNVSQLNAMIRGWHNYFKVASHGNKDFNEIAYKVSRTMYNRLRNLSEIGYKKARGYEKYDIKTITVADITIIPLTGISYQVTKNFTQAITNYTDEGRKLNQEKNLDYRMAKAVMHLAKNFNPSRSVEFNDNRISLFSSHKGKCYVSGIDLTSCIHQYHCHHKIPTHLGGKDEYKNLLPLHEYVHELVHAEKQETIEHYLGLLSLNEKAITTLNKLRKSCKLKPICV